MSLPLLKLALTDPPLARKKIAYARKKRAAMVKEAPYKKEYPLRSKEARLSRAAKGAIALPLGVAGAAALVPGNAVGVLGDLISGGMGKTTDPTALAKAVGALSQVGKTLTASPSMGVDASALLGTAALGGIGAGAGKLSEKLIPAAKKSLLDSSNKKKLLIAAALFPWVSTTAGLTYLANKSKRSDS